MSPGEFRQVTPCRRARPLRGCDEAGVTGRDGQGDTGGHDGPAPPGWQDHPGPGHQIGACVALTGVAGQREIGVEAHHRHGDTSRGRDREEDHVL